MDATGHYNRLSNCLIVMLTVLVLCLNLLGCAQTIARKPLDLQQGKDVLKPGLAVVYFHILVRKIDELPKGKGAEMRARPGKPIPRLDHRFGEGEVFDSGRSRGVGMHMIGYLRLSEPGSYVFKALSNDGIRVYLNYEVIISDEGVHSDRFSEPYTVEIDKPGWYPLKIMYFQRKGTATIEMHWKKPGASRFTIIPAEAYGHMPDEIPYKTDHL
jgi:hypothetical protein